MVRRRIALICSLLIFYPPVAIRTGLLGPWINDFKVYYLAALRYQDGYSLYSPGPFVETIPGVIATEWLYPPLAVIPFVPFTFLPVGVAGLLWTAINLFALWIAMYYLAVSLDVNMTRPRTLLLWACVTGFYPTLRWLSFGQVTGLLTAGLAVSLAFVLQSSDADSPERGLAGCILAAVAFVKPYYAATGTHLLSSRRRVATSILAGTGLFAVSLALFGVQEHIAYLSVLAEGKGEWTGVGGVYRHRFAPFHVFGAGAILVKGALLLGIIVLALVDARTGAPSRRGLALGSIAIPLIIPSANTITLSFALPGLFILLVDELQRGRSPALPLLAIALVHTNKLFLKVVRLADEALSLGYIADGLVIVHPATIGLLGIVVWIFIGDSNRSEFVLGIVE